MNYIEAAMNAARSSHYVYQFGVGSGAPGNATEDRLMGLLVQAWKMVRRIAGGIMYLLGHSEVKARECPFIIKKGAVVVVYGFLRRKFRNKRGRDLVMGGELSSAIKALFLLQQSPEIM
ncbi:hypothetical protein ACLOJK_023798 [Asimina triloba]